MLTHLTGQYINMHGPFLGVFSIYLVTLHLEPSFLKYRNFYILIYTNKN